MVTGQSFAQPIGLRADKMTGVKNGDKTLQYLVGNVSFDQNGSTVICDKAEYDNETKDLLGKGNVRIYSTDGVNITGGTLTFNDFTKVARVSGNVKLVDGSMNLTAPFIVYNTKSKVGYYGGGGRIIDGKQTLTSKTGSYNSEAKTLYFKGDVVLKHPDYTVRADTLQYRTNSKTAYFYKYTEITDGKAKIFCNNGWYQTENGKANFTNGAAIYSQGQIIKSDTLTFDRESGEGYAFGNMWVKDTSEQMILFGKKGYYNQKKKITKIMNEALLHRMGDTKDSLFMRADTFLYSNDTLAKRRKLLALRSVRIWQPQFSGFCDSLKYNMEDSVIRFFGSPVLYNETAQLSADSMRMKMQNNQLKTMWMYQNAMNVLKEDSNKFSQIVGNTIINYFEDGSKDLTLSHVIGNCESIYFIREKDSVISSANRVSSSEMKIIMQERKVAQIKMFGKPKGNLFPMDQFSPDRSRLSTFFWKPEDKPRPSEFAAPYLEPNIGLRLRQ